MIYIYIYKSVYIYIYIYIYIYMCVCVCVCVCVILEIFPLCAALSLSLLGVGLWWLWGYVILSIWNRPMPSLSLPSPNVRCKFQSITTAYKTEEFLLSCRLRNRCPEVCADGQRKKSSPKNDRPTGHRFEINSFWQTFELGCGEEVGKQLGIEALAQVLTCICACR